MIAQRTDELEFLCRLDEILGVRVTGAPLLGFGHIDGRAHFHGNRLGDVFLTGRINGQDFFGDGDSLGRVGGHPLRKGGLGRGNGAIHIRPRSQRNDRTGLFGRWVNHVVIIGRGRVDPFTVDVKLAFLDHIFLPRRTRARLVFRCANKCPAKSAPLCHPVIRVSSGRGV